MIKPLPRITNEQYIGLTKLMNWCIKKYQKVTDRRSKRSWKSNIDFLAELRRGQFYNQEQKERYNRIREKYYLDKK